MARRRQCTGGPGSIRASRARWCLPSSSPLWRCATAVSFPIWNFSRRDRSRSDCAQQAAAISRSQGGRMRASRFANAVWAFAITTAMAAAFAAMAPTAATAQATMTTPSGLKISDTKVGTGATPKPGQICVMHYTGWLYEGGAKGKKFDSSLDRGQPFEFPIGRRQVIAGWEEGVATMKVGGKRTLIIPPELGYGARGAGGVIPPNATLIFDVELLDVKG